MSSAETKKTDIKAIIFGVVFFAIMIAFLSPDEPKKKSENFLENLEVFVSPAGDKLASDVYQQHVDITIYNHNDLIVSDIKLECKNSNNTLDNFTDFAVSNNSSWTFKNQISAFSHNGRYGVKCKAISGTIGLPSHLRAN